MSKQKKTFAQKMQKTGIEVFQRCSKCGQNLVPHKVVVPELVETTGVYKFPLKQTTICNCNSKEYFN